MGKNSGNPDLVCKKSGLESSDVYVYNIKDFSKSLLVKGFEFKLVTNLETPFLVT